MNQSTDLLNTLIEVSRDGQKFYSDAANKVKDPDVRTVFETQANAREQLINDLSRHVAVRGESASSDETFVGRTRKLYADTLAKLKTDSDGVYIKQLAEAESRLLNHFREALEAVDTEEVRRVLVGHMPIVQAAHDRMRELKQSKLAA